LSYSDFERRNQKSISVNTTNVLVENNYIPIINRNDTVATDEIRFMHKILFALAAVLLKVDININLATHEWNLIRQSMINPRKNISLEDLPSLERIGDL
jgi:glutamate 5-kinase